MKSCSFFIQLIQSISSHYAMHSMHELPQKLMEDQIGLPNMTQKLLIYSCYYCSLFPGSNSDSTAYTMCGISTPR